MLFPPTNRPSVGKPEQVAQSGQKLAAVFGMFNSSILQSPCEILNAHACLQEGKVVANAKCCWPKENGLHFQLISLDGVPLGAETVDIIGTPSYQSNSKSIGPSWSRNPRCRRFAFAWMRKSRAKPSQTIPAADHCEQLRDDARRLAFFGLPEGRQVVYLRTFRLITAIEYRAALVSREASRRSETEASFAKEESLNDAKGIPTERLE